ncbi:fumarylacetoacetate hydrolase family protein [Nocardia jinanensis]|uniref:Fumarylacetoacetate hydrolase n=1 Tax=Nocardia jinanensis TaxID=382504 RepID=A0A917R5M2_9NOCA|nr:fumarylacetoacetate hydrolase family protein [Nocardia jinanensis]GGK89968.1 fumarylacetoacetate hydrolase [Nocardia jinanensis]
MTIPWPPTAETLLPADHDRAVLIGRVMCAHGPSVVTVRGNRLIDITARVATVRDLAEYDDPAAFVRGCEGPDLGSVAEVIAHTPPELRRPEIPRLLSPIDLQPVKAAGVTFVVSLMERVIEERCRGDASLADRVREQITEHVGTDLSALEPGSAETARLKELLVAEGWWSQYLEVGLGPDAEIFTKCAPMASVGTGSDIGVHPRSTWNNPEPEVVLLISSAGRVVGACLGNDVNLRDFEGRSALLLTAAKDNNASAAVGPFIRLFDGAFDLDTVRKLTVTLRIHGVDDFALHAESSMAEISRDPEDLVHQLMGQHHQYPDGVVLFLGTMFAPVQDRAEPGLGFTHRPDDLVAIETPTLGGLVNRVRTSDKCEPWRFGTADLFRSLSARGAL